MHAPQKLMTFLVIVLLETENILALRYTPFLVIIL